MQKFDIVAKKFLNFFCADGTELKNNHDLNQYSTCTMGGPDAISLVNHMRNTPGRSRGTQELARSKVVVYEPTL